MHLQHPVQRLQAASPRPGCSKHTMEMHGGHDGNRAIAGSGLTSFFFYQAIAGTGVKFFSF
jgi:hypothetical protein